MEARLPPTTTTRSVRGVSSEQMELHHYCYLWSFIFMIQMIWSANYKWTDDAKTFIGGCSLLLFMWGMPLTIDQAPHNPGQAPHNPDQVTQR
jgi:hypothetical protein